jgi:hypothetical protein
MSLLGGLVVATEQQEPPRLATEAAPCFNLCFYAQVTHSCNLLYRLNPEQL